MKLTKATKQQIEEDAINFLFKERFEEFFKLATIEVEKLLSTKFDHKWQRLKFSNIPTSTYDYVHTFNRVDLKFSDNYCESIRINLSEHYCQKKCDYSVPIISYEDTPELSKTYRNLINEKEKKQELIMKVLASCNTSAQLKEVSPDLFKFLTITEHQNQIIAVESIDELRQTFEEVGK